MKFHIWRGCTTRYFMQLSKMKKNLPFIFAAAVAVSFSSCVSTTTPEQRIAARSSVFEKLSDKDKESVSRGEISEGMSKEAVSLAWGSPDRRVEGLRSGKETERWDYRGTRPIVTNNFFGGYRSGFFRGSRRSGFKSFRYSGFGGGFGPSVTYVPYRKASVLFIGGRVNEWERSR